MAQAVTTARNMGCGASGAASATAKDKNAPPDPDNSVMGVLKAHKEKKEPTGEAFARKNILKTSTGLLDDNYKLMRGELGKGSYGTVCQGTNKKTNAVRAIKTIPKKGMPDIARFAQEIEVTCPPGTTILDRVGPGP